MEKIYYGHLLQQKNLVKINKTIIYRVIGYPTLGWPKRMHCDAKETIERDTGAIWNKRGMSIDTVSNPLVEFFVRVIAHKFYQSKRLNSVPCILVDLGYKIVKRDHNYNLVEL